MFSLILLSSMFCCPTAGPLSTVSPSVGARLADIVLWFHSVHTTLKLGGAYVWETLGLTPAATEINFEV